MSTENASPAEKPLVNLSEIAEIELFMLKRMKEYTLGDHASVFKGSGFNFVGLRDWEPGDRMSSIDWAQSSFNNFSPMIMREFEQDSTGTVIAVADASLSTRCGVHGVSIAEAIARSVAAVGLSALFFGALFGLITFDEGFRQLSAVRPRIGKPHVIYCLDLYERRRQMDAPAGQGNVAAAIAAHLRKTSLVPVISDFLFADAPAFIKELSILNAAHDVFLMMVDAGSRTSFRPYQPDGYRPSMWKRGRHAPFRDGNSSDSPVASMSGSRRFFAWRETRTSTSCGWASIGGRWKRF